MKSLKLFAKASLAIISSMVLHENAESRWYEPEHAEIGRQLFEVHCASCHRSGAAGAIDWQKPDDKGLTRPPPLNGTAHAWHHPLADLYRQIMRGSPPGVGNMPGFRGSLSRGEALAIIAYFQSLWTDEIYRAWERMDKAARRERSIE
jgi:mono/diheme cytochrome c family protein